MAATPRTVSGVRKAQRRRSLRQIWLPMGAAAIGLIVLPLLIALIFGMSGTQVGTMAAFLSAIFLAVPLVLLCMVPYALLLLGVVGMAGVNRSAPRYLARARNVSGSVNRVAVRASRAAAAPVIAVSKRLAWFERIVGGAPRLRK